jgi:sirohydrochlorin ferrochelatase
MDAILLVDHGSRRAEANDKLEELSLALRSHLATLGQPVLVTHAHMELAEPSIAGAVADLAQRGVTSIVCVPCFLARGRHVSEDIPQQFASALAGYPKLAFRMAAPLPEQPGFLDLLARAGGR